MVSIDLLDAGLSQAFNLFKKKKERKKKAISGNCNKAQHNKTRSVSHVLAQPLGHSQGVVLLTWAMGP